MKRNKYLTIVLAVGISLGSGAAFAALLGIIPLFPQIFFASGTTNVSGGSLTVTAAPIAIRTAPATIPIFINPSGLFETVAIDIVVDASCALVGGTGGDDLTVFGEVDLGGGDVRSGTLLTGEILAFGFEDGATTDLLDFRFELTGGLLADLYVNDDIGVLVQSENSTFSGNCSADSTGQAKGTLGAIPPILPDQGCTPGYWKQKHHFDSWEIYDPNTDTVGGVFGPLDPSVDGVLLKDALRLKGGGLNALIRHAVAALLNAANSDVAYNAFPNTADVIAATQAAVASGDYEPAKDAFEEANEEGCPLN